MVHSVFSKEKETLKLFGPVDLSKVQGKTRLNTRFARCRAEDRPALIPFITAGDPDLETSQKILEALPEAGADVIELGVPFSDPVAEGPPVQMSSTRALKAGHSLKKTLEMVRRFRLGDQKTPIILMGYYNPIYVYGVSRFIEDALECGVDGVLVVDLPREMDDELCIPAVERGLHFIHLATPTTDPQRLSLILQHASGFLYTVALAGVTGADLTQEERVRAQLREIKAQTSLPVAVGFGIKTPTMVQKMGQDADAVVVGSALVERIRLSLDTEGRATERTVSEGVAFVKVLSEAARSCRKKEFFPS